MFEIISNQAVFWQLKPLTKREFLNYLKYQEKSAENLQFYLWYLDYAARFAELPESERVLAPEWTEELAEAERKEYRQQLRARGHKSVPSQEMFKGTDFESKNVVQDSIDSTGSADATPFGDSEAIYEKRGEVTPFDDSGAIVEKHSDESEKRPGTAVTGGIQSFVSNFSQKADSAFDENGLKRPCKLLHNTFVSCD